MKYTVFCRVNDKEDSVEVYENFSFRDVYRDVLHVLKFKTLLETELSAFDVESEHNGFATAMMSIYKDGRYIALIQALAVNDKLLITVIRKEDRRATVVRCDFN